MPLTHRAGDQERRTTRGRWPEHEDIDRTQSAFSIGADAGLLDAPRAAAVTKALEGSGLSVQPMFTYLANTLRVGDREVPYSLVTAVNDPNGSNAPNSSNDPTAIVLTDWAAKDLGAKPGDSVTMEYYLFEDGQIVTRRAALRVTDVVPVSTGDRDMAPTFPGISDSPTLESWIRHFRLTFVASARRTSGTGSSTEQRQRPL